MAGSVWVRRRKNEDAIDCPFRRPPPGAQLKYSHRCLSSVLFKRRRPSPWNTCTTGAPSSSGRRRLRPVHQDRAISSTFLSDKSIRFKQLYIQIFEFRPLEFLKKLSPSPSYRFPCSQLAAPSEAEVKEPRDFAFRQAKGSYAALYISIAHRHIF